jgi:hypothetical protein
MFSIIGITGRVGGGAASRLLGVGIRVTAKTHGRLHMGIELLREAGEPALGPLLSYSPHKTVPRQMRERRLPRAVPSFPAMRRAVCRRLRPLSCSRGRQ